MFEFVFHFCNYNIITFLPFLSSSKLSHLSILALIQIHGFFLLLLCLYMHKYIYIHTYISKYNQISFYNVNHMFTFTTDLLLIGNCQLTCFSLIRLILPFSAFLSCLQFFMQYRVVCGFSRISKLFITLRDATHFFLFL